MQSDVAQCASCNR